MVSFTIADFLLTSIEQQKGKIYTIRPRHLLLPGALPQTPQAPTGLIRGPAVQWSSVNPTDIGQKWLVMMACSALKESKVSKIFKKIKKKC